VVQFELCALGSWVIGANMQCKLSIALQLEVAHHFVEGCAGERARRFEQPATFGTTKTPKMRLLNPHQLPAHGLSLRPNAVRPHAWHPLAVRGRSILLS